MRTTLSAARKRRGLTPEQLAREASLHPATVYRLEAGTTANPSHATVAALEDALGLRRGSLVFGEQAVAS
jgi:transcriptional regulator with XRE-family HTH domain